MAKGRVTVILLGTVAGLAVVVAGAGITLQMRERELRLAKERELTLVKGENTDLQQQLKEARQAKQHIEEELTRAKSEFEQLTKQFEQEHQAKEALTKSVDDRQREVDRLGKDIEQMRSERTAMTDQVSKLKTAQDSLQKQLAELQQAKAQLESKVLELSEKPPTVELDKVVVSGADTAPAPAPASSTDRRGSTQRAQQASAVQGQVLVVNREYDFVVVNLGKNQGLDVGQELQIVRDQQVLGRVKIEKIYDELSAAAILPDSKKDAIREGDVVKAAI